MRLAHPTRRQFGDTDYPKTPGRSARGHSLRDAKVRELALQAQDALWYINPKEVPDLDPEVAESYEEMAERGAKQRGEGRLP